MIEFKGQTVVVGGGAGEIGAATALMFARLGATVSICDMNEERGNEVAEELRRFSPDSDFVRVDMTQLGEVEGWVDGVLERRKRIQVAVNTAGWTSSNRFVDEGPEYWRRVVDINLMSCVHLAHAVIPSMTEAAYGRVVLMSSLSGRIGRAKRSLYGASKAGVIGFSKALAREVAPDGITVNGVAPGTTETALMRAQGEENTRFALAGIPTGQIATVDDQAFAVCFLASRLSGQITGQTISVDGGSTMV